MHKLRNIKWLPVLMILTILAIAAFQYYWLQKAYEREERTLEMRTNILFRETTRSLQAAKLKLDRLGDSLGASKIFVRGELAKKELKTAPHPDQKVVSMIDVMMQKVQDSGRGTVILKETTGLDTVRYFNKSFAGRRDRLIQFLFDVDSLQDSIKVSELNIAFHKRLEEQNLDVPYTISRISTRAPGEHRNEITLGFSNPITYRLDLGNTMSFLLMRIIVPILFSVFLVAFTLLSFSLLYRNLLRQRRLADIKNEFISNITHELKTPIATVSVAIEALKNFNASMDKQRTMEYLDISANELQRLSLLVDKVLKLSMFEKAEIELKYETLDMKELVQEVTSSMRLQFEKQHAEVSVTADNVTTFEGDRLHMVSVIFNLLDNALKYSADRPAIGINITSDGGKLQLLISDAGIGIPAEYINKIFEKFFRVPTGNLHNAKGYGLGLSYVAHVINKHKGHIKVESVQGDGTRFIITLPRHAS